MDLLIILVVFAVVAFIYLAFRLLVKKGQQEAKERRNISSNEPERPFTH